jgi:Ser/Thr protein kinase RdoA (MazF antagonist)
VNPLEAAEAFETPGRSLRAERIGEGAGHIHQTFRVECERGAVVLQKLNDSVFPDLDAVMANFSAVTDHLRAKLAGAPDLDRRVLGALPARQGGLLHRDAGEAWRCTRFIDGGRMPSEPATEEDARAAAFALGRFAALLSDLPVGSLREVLPGFHDTRERFEAFCAVADGSELSDFALAHEPLADALQGLGLPIRPVHNDTKLANVLLDAATGEGLCVLDLDTVMMGLLAHDFGDLVRSAAFDGAEEDEEVRLDLDRLRALAEGYCEGAEASISRFERVAFGLGARVIAFELGLRFLTDHLSGDRYFKVSRPGQNLARARSQFARLQALEAQADLVDRICAG